MFVFRSKLTCQLNERGPGSVCVCGGGGGGGNGVPVSLYFILKNNPYPGNRQNIPYPGNRQNYQREEYLSAKFNQGMEVVRLVWPQ